MLDKKIYGEVPEVVHNAVLDALDSLEEKQHRVFRLPQVAVACLACVLLSGVTVSAVEAIRSYRERMEEMTQEDKVDYYEIAMAGETTEYSRRLTSEEKKRYDALKEAYEKNGLFPESEIGKMQNAEEYTGKTVMLDVSTCTVYLPENSLNNEELLQLIDLQHKISYSIYDLNVERVANGSDWESRMAAMTDAEVDEVYLSMYGGLTDLSGGYSRELTEQESKRFVELEVSYEEEGLFALTNIPVIETPEEYTKEGVALCVSDSTYYLQEATLTDEMMLQIIDMNHKSIYCLDRIHYEIQLGLRMEYPKK